MNKWLIPRLQRGFNIWKPTNVFHNIKRWKNNKPYDHFSRFRKNTLQNPRSFHDKNSQQTRKRKESLQSIKENPQKTPYM